MNAVRPLCLAFVAGRRRHVFDGDNEVHPCRRTWCRRSAEKALDAIIPALLDAAFRGEERAEEPCALEATGKPSNGRMAYAPRANAGR